jgi:hypothetical protein
MTFRIKHTLEKLTKSIIFKPFYLITNLLPVSLIIISKEKSQSNLVNQIILEAN